MLAEQRPVVNPIEVGSPSITIVTKSFAERVAPYCPAPVLVGELDEDHGAGQYGATLSANDVQSQTVYHLTSLNSMVRKAVGIVVAGGFFVAAEVNPELGLLGIPFRPVMESNAIAEVEAPAVGFYLFPTLNRTQRNYLKIFGLDPGQVILEHVLTYGGYDVS